MTTVRVFLRRTWRALWLHHRRQRRHRPRGLSYTRIRQLERMLGICETPPEVMVKRYAAMSRFKRLGWREDDGTPPLPLPRELVRLMYGGIDCWNCQTSHGNRRGTCEVCGVPLNEKKYDGGWPLEASSYL
jgi:hypothetical protein